MELEAIEREEESDGEEKVGGSVNFLNTYIFEYACIC